MPRIRQELDRLVADALSDEPRLALAAARQLAAQQRWIEHRAVALARRHGLSWAVIGRLLGITRQSARERFATMRPAAPPPPPRRDGPPVGGFLRRRRRAVVSVRTQS